MKGRLTKIKLSGLFLISILFLGVKCDRPESVGPDYVIAPEGFTVSSFSAATPTINFSLPAPTGSKMTFNSNFSHKVSWTLKLRGLVSEAVKEISGTSNAIDGSNPAWLWDGSHAGLYFFRKDEDVEATITFLGSNLELKDTIKILGIKRFKDLVINEFETVSTSFAYNDATGGDNPSGMASVVEKGDLYPFGTGRKLPKTVQGGRSFYWYSQDAGNYFGGGGAIPVTLAQRNTFPLNAQELYLNVYIYGQGDANSRLNFGAREDDNGNGSHNPVNEDEFQVQITLDHVGWKLFSFKYSDLSPSASPTNGGSGDRVHQTRRITAITFGLISSPAKNYVEAIIDFPVVTFGGPFDPAK